MKITDEQKEKAAFVNLPQFLMAHGFDLKKVEDLSGIPFEGVCVEGSR